MADAQYYDIESDERKSRADENRRKRGLLLLLLLLLLLAIGGYLLGGLLPTSYFDDVNSTLKHDVRLLNQEIAVLNQSISALPSIYTGYTPPPPSLGSVGSIYIQPNADLIYYKYDTRLWLVATNATAGSPGPPGRPGPAGPPGPAGGQGIYLVGLWNSTTSYQIGDLVYYNNNTLYLSLSGNNTDNVPYANSTVNPFW